jgi:hypothetical protein
VSLQDWRRRLRTTFCITAKLAADWQLWVKRDRVSRGDTSIDVRYASNGDRIHARNKPSRCANRRYCAQSLKLYKSVPIPISLPWLII